MWERFSASTFWDTVAEFEPVTISAVPTILAAVLNRRGRADRRDLAALRHLRRRAAVASSCSRRSRTRFGIRILEGYGLTETTCISSINPYYGERKAGSIGLPVRGQEMSIVGEDGEPVERPANTARSSSRGPNVMPGYLKNAEATARDDPRRLAAHRRHRLRRRGRLLLHRRPLART